MSLFKKFRSSYFTHLVLSYSILAVVLIAGIGGYLFSQANALMQNELTKESHSRLAVTQDLLEQSVLPRYVEGLTTKYFTGVLPDYKESIYHLLDTGWETNMTDIVALIKQISFIQGANDGISNISIYVNEGNFAFDRNYFYPGMDESPDHAFLANVQAFPRNKWFMRTAPGNNKVLTYLVTLPFGFPADTAKGFMYLDVNVAYLTKIFTRVMNSPYEQLYLFDSEQKPILNTDTYQEQDSASVLRVLSSSSDNTALSVNQEANGSQIIATLKSDTLESFQYGIIRPLDSYALSSKQFQKKIVASCLFILVVGLLIAYLLSRKFYFPLKSILVTIKGLSPTGDTKSVTSENEYKLISRTIHYLDEKISSLESKVQNNELNDLLLGNFFKVSQIDRIPTQCQYISVAAEVWDSNSESFCQDIMLDKGISTIRFELTTMNNHKVGMLFYLNEHEENPDELIRSKFEGLRKNASYNFTTSIGSVVHNIEDIPASYREATLNLRYSYIFGQRIILTHAEIDKLSSDPIAISFEPLKNSLRAGSMEESEKVLQELETLCCDNVSIEVVELSQMQLLTALSEIVVELNLHHIITIPDLFRVDKANTLQEMMTWVRTLVSQIAETMQAGKTKGHSDLVNQIKDYIDERLHEDLSLNVLSELVSLSPSYISTIFADVLNVPFTEYVTKARLDKAADLLKLERSLSVADIAIQVGYRNSQYFCTKFKMKFGITPMQYRNSWS